MNVTTELSELKELTIKGSVVTIGNFDGVHVGHQKVLNEVLAVANSLKLPSICVTFDPHPLKILRPDFGLRRIFPKEDTVRELDRLGFSSGVFVNFNEKIAKLSAQQFVEDLLILNLRPRHIVVGHDFSFGKGREGTFEVLRDCGRKNKFEVTRIAPVSCRGEVVSSTKLRDLILDGDMAFVRECLGRPYYVDGIVQKGDQRGRLLGFPTANVDVSAREILPGHGVYVSQVEIGGELKRCVTNVGLRPTFGAHGSLVVECHVLNWSGDLYGKLLKVELLAKIRSEKKFSSKEELITQIQADAKQALSF